MTPEYFLSLVVALTLAGLLVAGSLALAKQALPRLHHARRARRAPRKRHTRIASYADGHEHRVVRYGHELAEITDAYLQALYPNSPLVSVREETQIETPR
jgi:hypothetical protein